MLPERHHEQIDRHNAIENLDGNSKTDWNHELTTSDEHIAYCKKYIHVLTKFVSIWNGLLGSIEAVQHRINLDKRENRPIHHALYRGGLKAIESEKQETDEVLAMDVIELPWHTGYQQLCSSHRKTNDSNSASIIGN